jgi:putative membrane protein
MAIVATVLVALVALIHLYFWYLEAVLWKTPRGRAIFDTTEEQADQMAPLAANQGLYNGFLAAGLVWGLILSGWAGFQFLIAFTVFAMIAGIYGGLTVSKRILAVQAAPALLALIAVLIAHGSDAARWH